MDIGTNTGFVAHNGDPYSVSVQYDIGLYRCQFQDTSAAGRRYKCDPASFEGPTFCPGIKADFWYAVYDDDDFAYSSVGEIIFYDEAGNNYTFGGYNGGKFCQPGGPWANTLFGGIENLRSGGYECTDEGLPNYFSNQGNAIPFGSTSNSDFQLQVTLFPPICLFDYPNDDGNNTQVIVATNGRYFYE